MNETKFEDFLAFVGERLQVSEDQFPEIGEWLYMANTIGTVALRFDIMTLDQIGLVLNGQETQFKGKRFGDIAVEMGFMSDSEKQKLLEIQDLHSKEAILCQLYLQGLIPVEKISKLLSEYAALVTSTSV